LGDNVDFDIILVLYKSFYRKTFQSGNFKAAYLVQIFIVGRTKRNKKKAQNSEDEKFFKALILLATDIATN